MTATEASVRAVPSPAELADRKTDFLELARVGTRGFPGVRRLLEALCFNGCVVAVTFAHRPWCFSRCSLTPGSTANSGAWCRPRMVARAESPPRRRRANRAPAGQVRARAWCSRGSRTHIPAWGHMRAFMKCLAVPLLRGEPLGRRRHGHLIVRSGMALFRASSAPVDRGS